MAETPTDPEPEETPATVEEPKEPPAVPTPRPGGRRAAQAEAVRDAAMTLALDRSRPAVGVFVDLENMAWSPDAANVTFDVARVMAFLERTSRPVVRRVYADWSRMRDFRTGLLRQGFEQVQCTYVNATKNALDMQMAVDALEAGLDGGLDGVVLVTADSDFGPLARTLRRRGLTVIGVGWAEKAADLYRAQCDVFVDYETLIGDRPRKPSRPAAPRPARPTPRVAAEDEDRPFLYDPRGAEEDATEAGEETEEFATTFETDTGEKRG